MISYIRQKIKEWKEKGKFHEHDFLTVDFELPREGKIRYAQWLHPNEFVNHPGGSGNVVTQQNVDFYRQFVKEGDLVIDIGAHEGDTTMPMALAVGKTGTTIALEPNPHSFKVLQQNASLNPEKTHIIPLNFAATAFDGEFTFGSSDPSFGNGGIVGYSHNKRRNVRHTFPVQGKDFQAYLYSHFEKEIAKLSLIKIDAEGYDKEIIRNLLRIIADHRPYIITECFGPSTSNEKRELFDLLTQQKYSLHRLEDFSVHSQKQIDLAEMERAKTFDIFAIPLK